MFKGFYGWSLDSVGKGEVTTKYEIEYINDKKVWDKYERSCEIWNSLPVEDKSEIWEICERKTYEDISKALTFYMRLYVDPETIWLRFYETVYVNGEMILEQSIEPDGITSFLMREAINRDLNNCLEKVKTESNLLKESNKQYEDFINYLGKQYKDMFKEFCKRRENNEY